MTQEEEQLLLKDLCARLPYRTRIHISHPSDNAELDDWLTIGTIDNFSFFGSIKPYLRLMSSMTEKEREIVNNLIYNKENIWTSPIPVWVINESDIEEYVDFCNSHHLDYRSLIKKGLALEAPEGMY